MGLFEKVAVTDLKLRLILGPAAIVFAASMFVGVQLFGGDAGLTIGIVAGLILAVGVAYGTAKLLP